MFGIHSAATYQIPAKNIASETNIGLFRDNNEDYFMSVSIPGENVSLVVAADGMGGHEGGEYASYFVVEELAKIWRRKAVGQESKERESEEVLVDAVDKANKKLHYINHRLNIKRYMGTTITAGLFVPGKVIVVHVGDSRAYVYRNKKLIQLTDDHTWVADQVRNGNLTTEEAENHPFSHLLSNCMGTTNQIRISRIHYKRSVKDRYLFCTDGLYGAVPDNIIAQTMGAKNDPKECVHELIEQAIRRGGKDNITGIVVHDLED